MKKEFVPRKFKAVSYELILKCDQIINAYKAKGFDLTLRQLYYQLVAKAIIENNERSYKNLGSLVNDARLAGMLDWEQLTDRTRNLEQLAMWDSPRDLLKAAARQYKSNPWISQDMYAEVWVEKEALAGVVERAADTWRVPWFCCRGYVSQSEMYSAAMRLKALSANKDVTVFYLGDHDPSGLDMPRDIQNRFRIFGVEDVYVERIALTWGQIEDLKPPPNPAKVTDSRFQSYQREHGDESFELDALSPEELILLIESKVEELIDPEAWDMVMRQEESDRDRLSALAEEF